MRPLERPAAAVGLPVAQDRAQALQARLLALAGTAKPPREPEPDRGERNTGDGSAERASELVARELGGVILHQLRETEAGWMDARTGELIP